MLKHLVKKEFIQLRRDRRMLPIVFMAPVLQLILFGYAVNVDVKDIITVTCDYDKTQESREYLSSFFNSGYFTHIRELQDCHDLDKYLDQGEADMAVVVPSGFGRALNSGNTTQIQAVINGTDSNMGSVGLNYILQINNRYASSILIEKLMKIGHMKFSFINLEDRVWYNPDLKSRNYMIPAILAMILMIMTMMLTAMAIVREKEIGTMEQLVVTPIKKYQIIIGKLLPFTIIGLIDVAIITAVTVFWFEVPFRGSFWLLYGMSVLFLLNTLGIGLFVSTVSQTQQQAMMTVMFFVMLPFIYLSGFVFPIENMPEIVQHITYAIPLRYFLIIIRGIFLKGVGLEVLWMEALLLAVLGTAILFLSVARFRKTM